MYELLVLFHVVSAIAWVGAGLLIFVVLRKLRIGEGDATAAETLSLIDRASPWLYNLAPLVVVATGLTMVIVSDAWAFSQIWVILAITLFVATGFVGGRLDRQIKAIARSDGNTSDSLNTAQTWFTVELVILLSIVTIMVLKPGV